MILHGAGSCKESHHDFARVVLAAGFAAIAFDQRGHGASEGPMDGRALEDVATMAALLRSQLGDPELPRSRCAGSSMGGYLAIARRAGWPAPRAVVAICPASAGGPAARRWPPEHFGSTPTSRRWTRCSPRSDLESAVESLEIPLLLLHAEGDEQVPVEHSRELAEHILPAPAAG